MVSTTSSKLGSFRKNKYLEDDAGDNEDETAMFEIERSPHVARKLASEQLSTGEMIGALSQYSCTLTDDTKILLQCALKDDKNTLTVHFNSLTYLK